MRTVQQLFCLLLRCISQCLLPKYAFIRYNTCTLTTETAFNFEMQVSQLAPSLVLFTFVTMQFILFVYAHIAYGTFLYAIPFLLGP